MFISCDSCVEETVLFILQKFTRFELCGLHHNDNNIRIIISLGNSFISLIFTTGGCEAQRESGEAARTSTVIQNPKRADGHTRKVPGSGAQCQVPSRGLCNQSRLHLGSHRAWSRFQQHALQLQLAVPSLVDVATTSGDEVIVW